MTLYLCPFKGLHSAFDVLYALYRHDTMHLRRVHLIGLPSPVKLCLCERTNPIGLA